MKVRDTYFAIMVLSGTVLAVHLSGNNAVNAERYKTAIRIEGVVMPKCHTFNPVVAAQLIRWIDSEIGALKSQKHLLGLGKARTEEAIQRLGRCRIRLEESEVSVNGEGAP
jgi:hypothetical protein